MSAPNFLELTLNEILRVINPSREDWQRRARVIDELQDVVSAIESLRGATVEPFGSFLSQLYTPWGDLDMSIELSNGSYISTAARKHKLALLVEVLKALRRTGRFRKLQYVLHARVPILKFESISQNIPCDISINNLSGQMKSKFLLWISVIDGRFRDMVFLVKEWAKANDINNPKTGTLNSYSLSLLVIFHFQTCVPAIFPPLRDIYPGNVADELIGVRADVERHIEEVSFANIAKFRKERRINHSSLPELLTSFFTKFSKISTRAADQGICTWTAQWEDIDTNTRWLPRTYAIFVEDPFEQPQNTARAVNSSQLIRIGEAFMNMHHRLTSPNLARNSLISFLVRPEISRFFPGVAFRFGDGNSGAYSRNHENIHRGNHSSTRFQPQLQNTRQGSLPMPPNNMTIQASQAQAQVNQQLANRKPRNQPNKVRQGVAPQGRTQPVPAHSSTRFQPQLQNTRQGSLPIPPNNMTIQASQAQAQVNQQLANRKPQNQPNKVRQGAAPQGRAQPVPAHSSTRFQPQLQNTRQGSLPIPPNNMTIQASQAQAQVNQQSANRKPRNQPNKVRQGAAPQGQAQPVPVQQVEPQLAHSSPQPQGQAQPVPAQQVKPQFPHSSSQPQGQAQPVPAQQVKPQLPHSSPQPQGQAQPVPAQQVKPQLPHSSPQPQGQAQPVPAQQVKPQLPHSSPQPQGQAQPVPAQQVNPQLPHSSSQPQGQANNVRSGSGEAQQVWRPKQSDK